MMQDSRKKFLKTGLLGTATFGAIMLGANTQTVESKRVESNGINISESKPLDSHNINSNNTHKGENMQILILGANGSVTRWVIEEFLQTSEVKLKLYLRKAHRLSKYANNERVHLVEGDVLDSKTLQKAMQDIDVVYANLAEDLESMANVVVQSMQTAGVKRLIWISSMGIYNEVPNQSYESILNPYRDSAKLIESSDLDYTIIRPAWFSNIDEVDYGLTKKARVLSMLISKFHANLSHI